MDARATELIKQGDALLNKRTSLMSLWQEIADNFYPERADFMASRSLGTDFAAHLDTSYPLLARRDLANAFSAMLRPKDSKWFVIRADREELEDQSAREWMDRAATIQRRAMYDRRSKFVRATKEGDHDFAAFGQCVLTVELNQEKDRLLFRCWHLRDVAWCENAEGDIDTVHRRWKPTVAVLVQKFRDKVDAKVTQAVEKDPYREIECRHIVIPAEMYRGEKRYRTPLVSLHIDVEHQHVMEEVGIWESTYVIPRWQTVSGSQYAHSPAVVAALPDARLIQAMTRVLLQAGEKAVDPPMIAVQEAIRSDIAIYAGGVTWVDAEYDEKLGEVLRPLTQEKAGIPLGMDMRDRVQSMISEAFYLNKLSLPGMDTSGKAMTAFEVGQRVQEYIRNALPLFEPMESDYNGALCDATFDLMRRNGGFGPDRDIPQSLRGTTVEFRFNSPLSEAIDRQKGQRFLEVRDMLASAVQIDPTVVEQVDVHTAFREALEGIGTPAKWMRGEEEVEERVEEKRRMAEVQQTVEQVGGAAQVAEQVGKAGQAITGMAA